MVAFVLKTMSCMASARDPCANLFKKGIVCLVYQAVRNAQKNGQRLSIWLKLKTRSGLEILTEMYEVALRRAKTFHFSLQQAIKL